MCAPVGREIGNLLPNIQRQRCTCYALCHILYPVSAALTSIFRMDYNSTSYHLWADEDLFDFEGLGSKKPEDRRFQGAEWW